MMLKIHDAAKRLMVEDEGKDVQVGWRVETKDFVFDAVEQEDGTVNTYVEWGDDQPGDIANHEHWNDVKRWLDNLLEAVQ
jgi:hypothetical protein